MDIILELLNYIYDALTNNQLLSSNLLFFAQKESGSVDAYN